MNTSISKNTSKKTTDSKNRKQLETEAPISEKDEVKKAEERTKKHLKGKS
ncbi:hypothetical protein [Mucilaginibacter sp. SG564]|nr:hypothetical protein [Mucilaginibacter sp. SG564]NOW97732.1 hypothetical protein [Mucilaginibacter sp. SG564]